MQEQNASSPLLTEIVSDITITVQMILALLEGIIMKVDLAALNAFPDIMNKEQMRIACHISKRTALFLLQYNLTWKLLMAYRDTVWSVEVSAAQLKNQFQIEYGTSIDDFL